MRERWYELNDLEKEIWKDIKDYEGLYQISNYGRVKSLLKNGTKEEKILAYAKSEEGYHRYFLAKPGKIRKGITGHRLVALHFIPKIEGKDFVNHKIPVSKERCYDYVENLEWCTHKENVAWSISNGYWGDRKNEKSSCSIPVNQYNKNWEYIKTWPSMREVQRQLGIQVRLITQCCRGLAKTAGGYKWQKTDTTKK